ncbi:Membrane protein insertase YidC [Nocardioides sp. T2.26MG-1]|uniref:membrane protein insertase YidC n=1 Tax=Nocardioides sp. T2.26MG-1 TaxID=3041166 RepID=UPI0024778C1D|nr:membrane protein insertase YidC [Nocardioides sp. T2.26MG-1]CAI9402683.1 Membrane protein insertase YidC [Nocardioides sp. T2.26MG-1]
MGALGAIGHFIMTPLYYGISAVLVGWHWLFSEVLRMDPDGGGTWVLSIIGLTLTVRALLIPLFVKQIKSSRNMQLIQPKVKELQKKYGHDRERLAQETMKLYKETGTNPFASCLPIIIQMPIFLALFRLLDHHAANGSGIAFLSEKLASSFGKSELFGAIPLKATFLKPEGSTAVQIVAALLVVAMTATTFTTQRQLMSKNMPPDALSGPYAQQQKLLLYVLPVVFAVGGIAFPIGVLFYWTTSNLWTMGQQFYVIRNNPAPGTAAAKAKADRDRAKALRHGHGAVAEGVATEVAEVEAPRTQGRQQPKKQSREQRKKAAPPRPVAGAKPKAQAPTKPKGQPNTKPKKQATTPPAKPKAKPKTKPDPEGEQQ